MIDAGQRLRLPSGASSTYYLLPARKDWSCEHFAITGDRLCGMCPSNWLRSSKRPRKRIEERRNDGAQRGSQNGRGRCSSRTAARARCRDP